MVDIPGMSGVKVFDAVPAYQPKEIVLDCWIKQTNVNLFNEQFLAFKTLLFSAGTKQLVIDGFTKPLVYQVQCIDGITLNKKWSQGEVFGVFELKLIDLFPVKMILKNVVTSVPSTLIIQNLTPKQNYWKIYWGDGTATVDIPTGETNTIQHTYTTPGTKYIVIPDGATQEAGINFGNAELLWSLQI